MIQEPVPADPRDRVRQAFDARGTTDYVFDFWTALGWTFLTLGVFGIYVAHKLAQRSKQHAQRQIAPLAAADEAAGAAALRAGRGEELRAHFERVAAGLAQLQAIEARVLDPGLWAVIAVFAGAFGYAALYWQVDDTLVHHEAVERDVEITLAEVFTALGAPLWAPYGPVKQPHNYGMRILATLGSFGVYIYWWLYDVMVEGNDHQALDWQWEAALVDATYRLDG